MGNEWVERNVEEVANVFGGGTPSTKDETNFNGEIPWITPKDLSGYPFRYISRGERNISERGLNCSSAKLLPIGAVLLTTRAPVGYVAIAANPVSTNQGFHSLVPRNGYSSEFIYYLLKANTEYLKSNASGTTFGELSGSTLKRLKFVFPSIPEQRAIADLLGSLDDKIELNRRMNATLESMARAVFRQWFVESGEAKGWKVVPLPEVIDVNPSRSLKKGEVALYLDMANMPTQGHRAIEWVDRPFGSGTKFINGDTLLARITPCLENGKTAFVDFLADDQVGWGSTEYIILRPKPPLPLEYGYYLARSEELRNHTIQNMTGTSGRQRAPASCYDKYMLAVPPESLANRFGDFARSVMAKIRSNDEQSRTLAVLRDALLPRLMSGEVRVRRK
jgi:type I restriction enzyme S subunit